MSAPRALPSLEPDAIVAHFTDSTLDPAALAYLRFHRLRYAALLRLSVPLVPPNGAVLDVGPSFQTALLAAALPDASISTLGFADDRFPPVRGTHTAFDLNTAQDPGRWPPLAAHDLIVLAEVIEHLHTAPSLVLACLATQLAAGGRLVVQTPNAAALRKRLELLAGRNPYEPIREQAGNPGHFRELTRAELQAAGARAGLVVETMLTANYFDGRHRGARLLRRAERIMHPSLRQGVTAVLRRP